MKKSIMKILLVVSVLSIGFISCSKDVKKDNSAEHEATRKAADKSVKELDKQ